MLRFFKPIYIKRQAFLICNCLFSIFGWCSIFQSNFLICGSSLLYELIPMPKSIDSNKNIGNNTKIYDTVKIHLLSGFAVYGELVR